MRFEYLILISRDLQFIEPPAYESLRHERVEVRKMLSGFRKTLQGQPV